MFVQEISMKNIENGLFVHKDSFYPCFVIVWCQNKLNNVQEIGGGKNNDWEGFIQPALNPIRQASL